MLGIQRTRWLKAAVLGAMLLHSAAGWGEADRKVVNKVPPVYPELARQMNIGGTVRIEVVIAANGRVKSLKPLGGHPLLIESAMQALRKWRYATGAETTTIVEFKFHPGD
jgi:TonB family protein